MFLLDTNIISEFYKVKNRKANLGLVDFLNKNNFNHFYTSEIVMMELTRGILLKARKDPIAGKYLKEWLEQNIKPRFQGRILGINEQTSLTCAKLHLPNFRSENDAWIASIAIVHHLILVTHNIKDFQNMPIELIDPFT